MVTRISLPGFYRGYTQPIANGYARTSQYVPGRDGLQLAADFYLPTLDGIVLPGAMPTVVVATGYRRAWRHSRAEPEYIRRRYPHLREGEIATVVNRASWLPDGHRAIWANEKAGRDLSDLAGFLRNRGATLEYLLIHGYAVCILDIRATGASFGASYTNGWDTGSDLSVVFEHLSEQAWCSGEIGMIGSSWLGGTQYFALTFGAPRLKAAIPQMADFDVYDSWFPGGVCLSGFLRPWSKRREAQDSTVLALPVDDDPEGALLAQALEERKAAPLPTDRELAGRPNLEDMPRWSRDELSSIFPLKGQKLPDGGSVDLDYTALDFKRANRNRTAIYFWGGWWDLFTRGIIIAYLNTTLPKKLLIGPWHHLNFWDVEEAHRWFDYWLKGVKNGIIDESSIVYSTSTADGRGIGWSGTDVWPPRSTEQKTFYLRSGPSTTISSINDGILAPDATRGLEEFDVLKVDFTASTGQRTRTWYSEGLHLDYSTLRANDTKGLTYTSAPLAQDLDIVGHPKCRLNLKSSQSVGIVVLYLQEVDELGRPHHLSEGVLNLEFARDETPAVKVPGVPFRSYSAASREVFATEKMTEVSLDLSPLSSRIRKGHRIRLSVHGADADNYFADPHSDGATLSIALSGERPTTLTIPVLSSAEPAEGFIDAFRDLPESNSYATRIA